MTDISLLRAALIGYQHDQDRLIEAMRELERKIGAAPAAFFRGP
jgi:hypothetical protein